MRLGTTPGCCLLLAISLAPPSRAGDWTFYRHDVLGTGNAGETLSASQAAALRLNRFYRNPNAGGDYDSNPIIANGMLYFVGGDHVIHAVDLTTFTDKWTKYIATSGPFPACIGRYLADPVGAPAVRNGVVYVPGADGVVYALDAATGQTIWQKTVADITTGEFLWSSIFPVDGKLYVGVSSLLDCALVPGRIVQLDLGGAIAGTWWADKNHGPGGGVWTQQAYDARTGRLFATTGTIGPGLSPKDQPWADAFVAIDPATMTTLDSLSPVPGDSYLVDADFGASPTLYDGPADPVTGAIRHYIAATDKNGYVYAVDRDNLAGGVLWSYQISGGGASPDFGESTIVSAPYANGMIFVAGGATPDGKPGAIAGLDAFTGSEKWRIDPGGFVLAGMTATDGVLFALVNTGMKGNGIVLALDQATGTELYRFTAGRMFGMPTWANGALYVGDATGAMFELTPNPSGPQADYDLVMGPLMSKGLAGGAMNFKVQALPRNGFNGSVALRATKVPAVRGVSASFAQQVLTQQNGYSTTLSVTMDPSVNTLYDLVTVGGSSSGLPDRTAGGWVIVQDFQLSAAPVTVVQGLSASTLVAVQRVNGFAGAVSWSVQGLPAGVSAAFDNANDPNGTTLTIATSAATPPGTYAVVVTGTATAGSRTVSIPFTVTQAADFQVAIDPPLQEVHAGSQAVYTVAVSPSGGFASGVSFAADSLPTGAQAAFAAGASAYSAKLTVSIPRDTSPGSWVFSVQVAGGGLVHAATAGATVLTPVDFALTAATPSIALQAGGTATVSVAVAPQNGFSSSVALGVQGLPAGVDASWDAAQTTGSATLTFHASAAAAAGSYPLTLTGTGGGLTRSTAATLTVTAPPRKTGCTSAGAPGAGAVLLAFALLTGRSRRRRSTRSS